MGELARNQQGNSDARANMERALRTDGWKSEEDGGMGRKRRKEERTRGTKEVDEKVDKRRKKEKKQENGEKSELQHCLDGHAEGIQN